jgi:hypothetical protein
VSHCHGLQRTLGQDEKQTFYVLNAFPRERRLGRQSICVAVSLVAWLFIGAVIWTTIIVTWSSANLTPAAATAVAVVLSPQSSEPLLLGVCVDVCADDESNDVEEGHPSSLGKELLSKGQRDGGHDPADLHDGPEASLDGCANLVECSGTGNKGHRDEVDAVLDR